MTWWEDAYRGTPPWEIGRPQNVFVRLDREGAIAGSVLDIGCGTGENSLYLAAHGHEVWGVDIAPNAIQRAQIKAHALQRPAVFLNLDILAPDLIGRTFDSAIDSGCFHALSDHEQRQYARSVRALLEPGGVLQLLAWSDEEPGTNGPRRLSERDIRDVFTADHWLIEHLVRDRYETLSHPQGAKAWLASIRRLDA
jgi:SAM-dependent methyltransferase